MEGHAQDRPVGGDASQGGDTPGAVTDSTADRELHLPEAIGGTGDEAVRAIEANIAERDGCRCALGIAIYDREDRQISADRERLAAGMSDQVLGTATLVEGNFQGRAAERHRRSCGQRGGRRDRDDEKKTDDQGFKREFVEQGAAISARIRHRVVRCSELWQHMLIGPGSYGNGAMKPHRRIPQWRYLAC